MASEAGPIAGSPENRPQLVEAFAALFSQYPVKNLIGNLETQVDYINCNGLHFPLSFNDGTEPHNCYICSPKTAYIDYAIDETRNFNVSPHLKSAVRVLIAACRPIVRMSGLDNQVQLNNWLFSTNPVPQIERRTLDDILTFLVQQHPGKAIVIRSVNDVADQATIRVLKIAGFNMLPARQIYIFADRSHTPKQTINMRRDKKLLRKPGFQFVGNDGFSEADYVRCEQLYNMLYLEKYTPLNPHYTALCIAEMHRRGILKLAGFRDAAGTLVAVTGLFENGRTLTQPIVGYDTSLPLEAGLYRLLMAYSQSYASEYGLFFNMSAGAASFKRIRGAVPSIEYTAVYIKHLRVHQRLAVRFMSAVLTRIGIPLLRRYKL